MESPAEFSTTTVSLSLSLTTVVLAFAELAPFFGLWLFAAVFTTSAGLVIVRWAAPVIWRRLGDFGVQRPTLHEFLGANFNSPVLAATAALCTTLGFLGALAVELTVGSRFLAALAPDIDTTLAVVLLSGVGISYTLLGGFRVVVQTDRAQMFTIWCAILALAGLVAWQVHIAGGLEQVVLSSPPGVFNFSWREGLGAFLVGLAVINIPTFLADMAMWQRIAGTREEATLKKGLVRSIVSATLSWSSFVFLACLIVALVPSSEGTNPLGRFLELVSANGTPVVAAGVFIVIVGLYGASLSTASTQLIAAGHAMHLDLVRRNQDRTGLATSAAELKLSRALVLALGVGSIVVVESLRAAGFTIADLVFAIYGAQLGMVPAVLLALFGSRKRNATRGSWIAAAISFGFVVGWLMAGYGKLVGDANFVFLAPVGSLAASSAISLAAIALRRAN